MKEYSSQSTPKEKEARIACLFFFARLRDASIHKRIAVDARGPDTILQCRFEQEYSNQVYERKH
jgi:hypothetical protein